MLVRCPQCKSEFRLAEYASDERVVKYLCPACDTIVRVDLELDEVRSSSTSGSYRAVERRMKVLVADDSEAVLHQAEHLLNEAGYHVVLAADGREALRLIRDEHPDLIVLDMLMPRMTGFDVLREIRHDDRVKDTPVLAMSGVYKENILGFLHQLGAQGFLDKQQIQESLVFRVQGLLTSRSAG